VFYEYNGVFYDDNVAEHSVAVPVSNGEHHANGNGKNTVDLMSSVAPPAKVTNGAVTNGVVLNGAGSAGSGAFHAIRSAPSQGEMRSSPLRGGLGVASLSFQSILNLPNLFADALPSPNLSNKSNGRSTTASNRPDDPDFWVNRLPYQSQIARSAYHIFKRGLDLGAVILSAPVTLPVGVLIALLLFLDSGKPIFFKQQRTGLGGHRFLMFKFRTMVPNAEAMLRDLAAQGLAQLDANGKLAAPLKLGKDPRVTRLGRILRKTSLDELPQLLNVLRGEMSLVGPRPTSWDLGSYSLPQTERLNAKPGITGLWQVYGRGATDFGDWVKWDVMYFEKMSFSLDLRLLALTVLQVLKRKGAR
jgi:lipopolysaccharide/colanic/teichoic acid biosynthesis glycosyltransferase